MSDYDDRYDRLDYESGGEDHEGGHHLEYVEDGLRGANLEDGEYPPYIQDDYHHDCEDGDGGEAGGIVCTPMVEVDQLVCQTHGKTLSPEYDH